MSIPVSIDPLGTLGANPLHGYVTDGLILAFDGLLEQPGERSSLKNWASGTICPIIGRVTVADGCIQNVLNETVKFNEPMAAIDGKPAFGLGYSADICAKFDGYMRFGVWGENIDSKGYYCPGMQLHNNPTSIRVMTRVNESSPLWSYPAQLGKRISAHVEFNSNGYIRVDGAVVGELATGNAGIGSSCSFYASTGAKLFAYRLYNRQLTSVEQRQNYAMDKKRFGL